MHVCIYLLAHRYVKRREMNNYFIFVISVVICLFCMQVLLIVI